MKQKGQASSVFQLLIAALVALAILIFLLQIIGRIPGLGTNDPTVEAGNVIKSALLQIGTPLTSTTVSFPQNYIFNARTIAEKSGQLSASEVCVTYSTTENSRFRSSDASVDDAPYNILTYTGSQKIDRKLYVLCDSERQIQNSIDDVITAVGADAENIFGNSSDHCGNFDSGSTNKVCVVSVTASG